MEADVMTDQELESAVQASREDWYSRAADLGVTAATSPSNEMGTGVTADTWTALNPGTVWAADEDRAAVNESYWCCDRESHKPDYDGDGDRAESYEAWKQAEYELTCDVACPHCQEDGDTA